MTSIVQGQHRQWTYAVTGEMTFLHPEVGVHRFQHDALRTTLDDIGAERLPLLCALICQGFEKRAGMAPALGTDFVQNTLWLAWAVRTQLLRRTEFHLVARPPVWGMREVPLVGTLPELLRQSESGAGAGGGLLLRKRFSLTDYLPAPFVAYWSEQHPDTPITLILLQMHDFMTALLDQGRTDTIEPLLGLLLPSATPAERPMGP